MSTTPIDGGLRFGEDIGPVIIADQKHRPNACGTVELVVKGVKAKTRNDADELGVYLTKKDALKILEEFGSQQVCWEDCLRIKSRDACISRWKEMNRRLSKEYSTNKTHLDKSLETIIQLTKDNKFLIHTLKEFNKTMYKDYRKGDLDDFFQQAMEAGKESLNGLGKVKSQSPCDEPCRMCGSSDTDLTFVKKYDVLHLPRADETTGLYVIMSNWLTAKDDLLIHKCKKCGYQWISKTLGKFAGE